MDEFKPHLKIGFAEEDDIEADERVPDAAFQVGWLLVFNWVDPDTEGTWTTVSHPEGMLYISRLGLAHSAVEAIG